MPVQSTDRNTTWFITADNKTWTLAEGASIEPPSNNHGITENGHSGSLMRVLGDIHVRGVAVGVYLNGSDSTVFVGKESVINARTAEAGIFSATAGGNIENHGRIDGGNFGIEGAIWGDVQNYGTVSGQTAISFDDPMSQIYNYGLVDGASTGIDSDASGTYIENSVDGEILGGENAIVLLGIGSAEIRNRGTIRGDKFAIVSEDSTLNVRNTGNIVGDVALGGDNDRFDTRGGTVKGKVYGDNGDDLFIVSSKLHIVEASGAGSGTQDKVISTISYALSANIEDLSLIGKAEIDAEGNGGANHLYGNAGNNKLTGNGGMDHLSGGRGHDTLTGGKLQDVFYYWTHGDVDHITDFQDGTDLLWIEGVVDQATYDALDIRQIKGDTVINLGHGDKLVIDNLLKSDLDFASDFTV